MHALLIATDPDPTVHDAASSALHAAAHNCPPHFPQYTDQAAKELLDCYFAALYTEVATLARGLPEATLHAARLTQLISTPATREHRCRSCLFAPPATPEFLNIVPLTWEVDPHGTARDLVSLIALSTQPQRRPRWEVNDHVRCAPCSNQHGADTNTPQIRTWSGPLGSRTYLLLSIERRPDFPEDVTRPCTLDRTLRLPHVSDDSVVKYNLIAFAIHIPDAVRPSANGGHFKCYVSDAQSRWYHCDDSVVNPIHVSAVPFADPTKGFPYLALYVQGTRKRPAPPATPAPGAAPAAGDPVDLASPRHARLN